MARETQAKSEPESTNIPNSDTQATGILLMTEEEHQLAMQRLREEYGDQWLEENRERLDREWEMLKDF